MDILCKQQGESIINVEKDFREYWTSNLERGGLTPEQIRNTPEYVKVLLHEYYFLWRQFTKVLAHLNSKRIYPLKSGLFEVDEEGNSKSTPGGAEHWTDVLAQHGVQFNELPKHVQVLLLGYWDLQHEALIVYKHYTNGVIDRLSWCGEPIIEEIKKIEQGAA